MRHRYLGLAVIAALSPSATALETRQTWHPSDKSLSGSSLPVCTEPGWFCPTPGTTAFCNKLNRYVDGRVCPVDTCCSVLSNGTAACTEEACSQYGTSHDGKVPVCEKPGWFCPSPGTTGFCNKLGRFVDGHVCPVGTCCETSTNGTAACTEVACQRHPPETRRETQAKEEDGDEAEPSAHEQKEADSSNPPSIEPVIPPPARCHSFGWFCPRRIETGFCGRDGRITDDKLCGHGTCCGLEPNGTVACTAQACEGWDHPVRPPPRKDEKPRLPFCEMQSKPGWACPHRQVAVRCNDDFKEAEGFHCEDGTCCIIDGRGRPGCDQNACYWQVERRRNQQEEKEAPSGSSENGKRLLSNSSKSKAISPGGPKAKAPGDDGLSPMLDSTGRPRHNSSYPPFFEHEVDDNCIIGQVRCYHHDHASPPGRREDTKSHVEVCNGSHKWMVVEVCEEPEKRCEMVAGNNAKCVEVHW